MALLRTMLALVFACSCDALIVGGAPMQMAPSVHGAHSAALCRLRAEAPPPPPKGRLGATIDQDGKSNVWAVEPTMQVDQASEKGAMAYAPVVAVAAGIVLLLPLLPLLFAANPDQA